MDVLTGKHIIFKAGLSHTLPRGGIQGDIIVCDTAHGSFPSWYGSLLLYTEHGIILNKTITNPAVWEASTVI